MEIGIEFTNCLIEIPPPARPGCETGAVVEFQGIVRELEEGRPIPGLHYEAHIPMARHRLGRILEELRASHPCQAIQFIHRLGFVPTGEVSLFLRVLAAHRQPAFALAAALIDRLKEEVPIWKSAPIPESPPSVAAP